ncbi:hypothetical protein D3C71_1681790 [compost metagenome]
MHIDHPAVRQQQAEGNLPRNTLSESFAGLLIQFGKILYIDILSELVICNIAFGQGVTA